MKTIGLIICISATCVFQSSAQSSIKFAKEYHDFGELKEGDQASYEFDVTNTGKEPLIIAGVQPSCGCTTPDWTKEPIAPGATGKIKASYNTVGRVGFFNKSITVNSNADVPSRVLYIRGNVIKKEDQPVYTAEQLKLSPKIVLDKTQHTFGTVEKNTKITYKIQVKNLGRSDLKIADVTSACNCVKIISKPDYIKSGELGVVALIYTPNGLNEIEDVLIIKSNDITNPSVKFIFKGRGVESLNSQSILKEDKGFVPFK